jgi:cysteine desulfurase
MKYPIYLDYAATTPTDPLVLNEMLPYFSTHFGNSGSRHHAYGWMAQDALETASIQIAKLMHCEPKEIIFTSGATESINLAIKGLYKPQAHYISINTEHKATLETLAELEKQSANCSILKVDGNGQIDLNELENSIQANTVLISVCWVNNETGVILPIEKIIEIAHRHQVKVHVDATQAIGKLAVDFKNLDVDLMSFSAHKIYGPKGVGVLIKKHGHELQAQINGGGQQRSLRSGTLNIPGIVGLAKALELAVKSRDSEYLRIEALSQKFAQELLRKYDFCKINAAESLKVPHILNICFEGQDGEELLNRFSKIAISNGSACNSASTFPSYVLKAMGLNDAEAYASLRFSFGRLSTESDIDQALENIFKVL